MGGGVLIIIISPQTSGGQESCSFMVEQQLAGWQQPCQATEFSHTALVVMIAYHLSDCLRCCLIR